jgi:hypothetical protein
MKISNDVANVLANSQVEENRLFLPPEQLDRKLYVSVNKVLEAIGGKWSRKEKAHLFEECPEETIEDILQTGEYTHAKNEYNFFETPEPLARRLIELAGINGGTVLEPSAGRGAIAKFMQCKCIELEDSNRKYLTENGFNLIGDDFLQFTQPYDYIIANPPFSKQRDIDHVTHMIELARKRVVSVMSASVLFRTNRKTLEFRDLVESKRGEIIPLPEGSFKTSGTNVNTCVVVI